LKGFYGAPRIQFMNRLKELGIAADCLPHEQLFREKHLFLYDVLVVPPRGALEKGHYEDIKTFVAKGGVFIPFTTGGSFIDWDGSRGYGSPPDVVVSSKGGVFYELTGGALIPQSWGGWVLREFSVLRDSPITEGFKLGEQLRADVKGVGARYQAEGTIVVCGKGTLLSGKTERTTESNVIQTRRYGKGASIWVSAELQRCTSPWADRLLTNLFSEETVDWCRGEIRNQEAGGRDQSDRSDKSDI